MLMMQWSSGYLLAWQDQTTMLPPLAVLFHLFDFEKKITKEKPHPKSRGQKEYPVGCSVFKFQILPIKHFRPTVN